VVAAPRLGPGSGSTVTSVLGLDQPTGSATPAPRTTSPSTTATTVTATATATAAGRTSAAPAVPPPQAPVTAPKLAWAPPTLSNPLTETVTAGHRSLQLDPARDYTVVLPRTPGDLGGGVTITGGHNVVIIGGIVQVPSRSAVPSDLQRRGMYLKSQTGTIHIEGVHLTGDLSDGFNLAEDAGATVQLENVRIDLVHGSQSGHHADVLQTWAGPKVLRVDGLQGSSQYQGFFLLPNELYSGPKPQSFVFRRTVLTMMPNCGYALWLPENRPSWLDYSGITVRLGAGVSPDKLSWPDAGLGLTSVGQNAAPDLPAGPPGGSYASPGYA
jgi:hypothetical protein